MKRTIVLVVLCFSISCSKTTNKEKNENKELIKNETFKLEDIHGDSVRVSKELIKYERVQLKDIDSNGVRVLKEVYVSTKKDTFVNQIRTFENDVLNKKLSKYFEFSLSKGKKDSIFQGTVKIFSPADSISESYLSKRSIRLTFRQKNKDSTYWKVLESNTNIISFTYKDFDTLNFVGFIYDLRFFEIEHRFDRLIFDKTLFAIDNRIKTDNPHIEMLE